MTQHNLDMTYSEKLKDPRWQKRRLQILERDGFTCQYCNNKTKSLSVHHLAYNGDPWEAFDADLITICQDCHEREHKVSSHWLRQLIIKILETHFPVNSILVLAQALLDSKNTHEESISITVHPKTRRITFERKKVYGVEDCAELERKFLKENFNNETVKTEKSVEMKSWRPVEKDDDNPF